MPGPCRLWPFIMCATKTLTALALLLALVIAVTWAVLTLAFIAAGQI
jgi:hypothetical protein